jgi:hypothetical protein
MNSTTFLLTCNGFAVRADVEVKSEETEMDTAVTNSSSSSSSSVPTTKKHRKSTQADTAAVSASKSGGNSRSSSSAVKSEPATLSYTTPGRSANNTQSGRT